MLSSVLSNTLFIHNSKAPIMCCGRWAQGQLIYLSGCENVLVTMTWLDLPENEELLLLCTPVWNSTFLRLEKVRDKILTSRVSVHTCACNLLDSCWSNYTLEIPISLTSHSYTH